MDRVYHDRRMLKWLPFEALPEQGHYLKAVYDYLNWKALEAFHQQDVVQVEVYHQGRMVIYKGTLRKIDYQTASIHINGLRVPFDDVINIC